MDWIKCIRNRLLRAARREAGITVIETMLAIAIFGVASTSLIGVLTSATAADGRARQKSIALELGQQQIEYLRQLNYISVGVAGGNPGGVVQGTQSKWVAGFRYILTTRIKYVRDPISGGVVESANYKQVRVIVTRALDNKEMARISTYVSDSARLSSGSLNNSLINVTVTDFFTNDLLGDAEVTLTKTWDASFTTSDHTGTEIGLPTFGLVTFEGLAETPISPLGYYDVAVSLGGYVTVEEDKPPALAGDPANAAHLTLEKSGTKSTVIRLYKGSTINVRVEDGDTGILYTGPVTVTISSTTRTDTEQFATSTGTVSTGTLNGVAIVPGSYTVSADTADYRHGEFTDAVPEDYSSPSPSKSYTVKLGVSSPPQYANFTVTVRRGRYGCSAPLGSLEKGAQVDVYWTGDLTDPAHTFHGTTDYYTGAPAAFTGVPLETEAYEIRARRSYRDGTITRVVADGANYCVGIW